MTATKKLLDKWMICRSLASYKDAAAALHVTPSTISNWRAGTSQAEVRYIAQMARDCAEDPFIWIAHVESERARSDPDRKVWAALARRLGAAAAVAAVALLTSYGVRAEALKTRLQIATFSSSSVRAEDSVIYIMRTWMRRLFGVWNRTDFAGMPVAT